MTEKYREVEPDNISETHSWQRHAMTEKYREVEPDNISEPIKFSAYL